MKKLSDLTDEDSKQILTVCAITMQGAMDFETAENISHELIELPAYPLTRGSIEIVKKLIELGYETGFEIKNK